jgi:predicted aconitase with swiveling domain
MVRVLKVYEQSGSITATGPSAEVPPAGVRESERTPEFDLDNGAGTTIDSTVFRHAQALTITGVRIVYDDATTGTVAAGNARVGTTVGGSEIVAATAYGNAAAVGTQTAMTIVSGAVAAGVPVIVRHTGVAATQAGKAHVEIDYDYD